MNSLGPSKFPEGERTCQLGGRSSGSMICDRWVMAFGGAGRLTTETSDEYDAQVLNDVLGLCVNVFSSKLVPGLVGSDINGKVEAVEPLRGVAKS